MGDPRKQRRKYETPPHPWQRTRIEREKELSKKYGLKTKTEIWKMDSMVRKFKRQAKSLITRTGPQAKKEEELLIKKLYRMGLVQENAKIEDILDLDTSNIMERRLQTIVKTKGLARTSEQARQFITHQHITVKSRKINIPSYMVARDEENEVAFRGSSALSSPDHPERAVPQKEAKPEVKAKTEEKPQEKAKAEKE